MALSIVWSTLRLSHQNVTKLPRFLTVFRIYEQRSLRALWNSTINQLGCGRSPPPETSTPTSSADSFASWTPLARHLRMYLFRFSTTFASLTVFLSIITEDVINAIRQLPDKCYASDREGSYR
jgi:hypothetical protein